MTVNTNVSALIVQNGLNQANQALNRSLERLSSGYRINHAKDDAAGLQISNRLTTQIRGLDVAMRNASDGISVMQTAEGAMQESTSLLQRMRDLALQSANGSNSRADQQALQEEYAALNDELNRIAETTAFGGRKLLNGTFGKTSFQVGASSGEAVQMSLGNMRSDTIHMGGRSYVALARVSSDWVASPDSNQLVIHFRSPGGQEQHLEIRAKAGDDIEELATSINGQTDLVSASVNEHGQLQIYMAGESLSRPLSDLPQHQNSGNHSQNPQSKDDIESYKADDRRQFALKEAGDFRLDDVQRMKRVSGLPAGQLSFSGSLAAQLRMRDIGYESVNNMDISTTGGAQRAISVLDTALTYVDKSRAALGAYQNRFGHTMNNLANIRENLSDSKSRIKDTDYAKEVTQLMKQQILQQVSVTVLAQAKKQPARILDLLN